MHRIRVYVDSSVFGGVRDKEFADATSRFLERVKQGRYVVLVSDTVLGEIARGPEEVQTVVASLPPDSVEFVSVGEETAHLADAYVAASVLGARHRVDASHVAAATVNRADLILSWNFRHIVNYERIQRFTAVNLLNGYTTPDIRSPQELAYDDTDEDV